ncbi:hypothetical protein [Francisella halioticida]|nr:hypothetical protein [Francisella halioticida]
MTPETLLTTLTEKINEVSSDQLNDALIAGEKILKVRLFQA